MTDRHPALVRLDALLGTWIVQPRVGGVRPARCECTWDGAFLRQYTETGPGAADPDDPWRDHAPFPTDMRIGLDDAGDDLTVLYADARGVHRVYAMTFDGETWTMARSAPGFSQRFTATLAGDGHWDGRWERSADDRTWELDFELTYTREK
ncbi:MAG TPA: hypothetical protein VGD67_11045 [Pseudonocardiaceae bacterium]